MTKKNLSLFRNKKFLLDVIVLVFFNIDQGIVCNKSKVARNEKCKKSAIKNHKIDLYSVVALVYVVKTYYKNIANFGSIPLDNFI